MGMIINSHRFGGGGAPSSLLTGLVSFWKLDEASGTRNDSVGSNHLTDNNTVTQNTGKIGNAAEFVSGNSEYLSIADNSDLSTGDIDFTIAFWVYPSIVDAYQGYVEKGAGGAREYLVYFDAPVTQFSLVVQNSNEVHASSFGTPSANTWYFIVAWHDSVNNTINIQVNNGAVDSQSYSGGVTDGSGMFQVGRISNPIYCTARIDAMGFWKKVLSAGERTELYNAGSGKEPPF